MNVFLTGFCVVGFIQCCTATRMFVVFSMRLCMIEEGATKICNTG